VGLLAGVLGVAGAGTSPAQQAPSFRLGVMVEEPADPVRIIGFYSDLLSQLRARLVPAGIQVPDVVIAKDHDELSRLLREGEVDFVIETVFASQLLRERSGNLEPALALVRDGQREYQSVFFTREDSDIERLEDLRGRTLVLEAPRSTSAFALPQAELARNGIEIADADVTGPGDRVARYVLAGAELNQAVWVVHGRGDAAAFSDGDWEALPAGVRDQLRIFHRTRKILRGLLSIRGDLEPRLRERCEALLLTLHEDPAGQAAMSRARITRFERLTQRDRSELDDWEAALRSVTFVP
jgi:phosphonate transport system substrate-binding protein